jgi:Rrf2 family transcriptional regulator, iron-sulfur cluster assembly transcription factor
MSLISRTAQYALRAMAVLASHQDRLTVRQLAETVGAPPPYLARIVMLLANEGLVTARRGPGGGLRLGRPSDEISLMNIVACFDGPALFEECALGLPGCADSANKCPVHDDWGGIRDQIQQWWHKTTLADFDSTDLSHCMSERATTRPEAYAKIHRLRVRWH